MPVQDDPAAAYEGAYNGVDANPFAQINTPQDDDTAALSAPQAAPVTFQDFILKNVDSRHDGDGYSVGNTTGECDGPDEADPQGEVVQHRRMSQAFADIALVVLVAALLLAETIQECRNRDECSDNMIWGLVCAALAILSGMPYLIRFGCGARDDERMNSFTPAMAFVQLVIFSGAVAVLTFDGPFDFTGNGYFFTWGGAALAGHAVFVSVDSIEELFQYSKSQFLVAQMEKRVLAGCVLAAAVVLTQSLVQCVKHECTAKLGFGVAVGAFSVVYGSTLCLIYEKLLRKWIPLLALALAVVWAVTGMVLTGKGGPYERTGNGFFGCWVSMCCAVAFLSLSSRTMELAPVKRESQQHEEIAAEPVDEAERLALKKAEKIRVERERDDVFDDWFATKPAK